MPPAGAIAQIWRYPVKSLAGHRVDVGTLEERGMHADRMWAVRDLELGAVTTGRRLPRLIECSARFAGDPPADAGPGSVVEVIVTFPDGTEVSSTDTEAMDARLTALCRKPVKLVPLPAREDKAGYKGVKPTQADTRAQLAVPAGEPIPDSSMVPLSKLALLGRYATPPGIFADLYPLHIITRASMAAMAARAPGSQFDVRRFRPDVVVETDGDPALEEFDWLGGLLRAPAAAIRVQIPTIRCAMPTRPQADLPADPEVIRTISEHADRCLGVYCDVEQGGPIAVGEQLELEPAPEPGAIGAAARRVRAGLKRRLVSAGSKAMPKG